VQVTKPPLPAASHSVTMGQSSHLQALLTPVPPPQVQSRMATHLILQWWMSLVQHHEAPTNRKGPDAHSLSQPPAKSKQTIGRVSTYVRHFVHSRAITLQSSPVNSANFTLGGGTLELHL
jgi:hypothetical protein